MDEIPYYTMEDNTKNDIIKTNSGLFIYNGISSEIQREKSVFQSF